MESGPGLWRGLCPGSGAGCARALARAVPGLWRGLCPGSGADCARRPSRVGGVGRPPGGLPVAAQLTGLAVFVRDLLRGAALAVRGKLGRPGRSDADKLPLGGIGLLAMDRHVADLQVLVGYAQLDEQSDDFEEDECEEGVPDDDRERGFCLDKQLVRIAVDQPGAGESRDL